MGAMVSTVPPWLLPEVPLPPPSPPFAFAPWFVPDLGNVLGCIGVLTFAGLVLLMFVKSESP